VGPAGGALLADCTSLLAMGIASPRAGSFSPAYASSRAGSGGGATLLAGGGSLGSFTGAMPI